MATQCMERRVDCILGLSLNTAIGTTPEIPFEAFSGGTIHIPTGSSITTLTWYTAPFQTGRPQNAPGLSASQTQTFQPAKDSSGTAVTQTVTAANSFPIPTALFGAGSLKCVVNAAGTVDICLKT